MKAKTYTFNFDIFKGRRKKKMGIKPCVAHGISSAMHFKFTNAKDDKERKAALNEEYYTKKDIDARLKRMAKIIPILPGLADIEIDEVKMEERLLKHFYEN